MASQFSFLAQNSIIFKSVGIHEKQKDLKFTKDMGSVPATVVCVKQVKQDVEDDWDETMPLPGDIIEGCSNCEAKDLFIPTKLKSELSSQLGTINQQYEAVWLKVRRGNNTLKLRARIVQEKSSILQRKFTIRAATDDRHVAILGDLTLDQCSELQEMSRRVVNIDDREFEKKGINYDWKVKMEKYLPDQSSPVISSILFVPLKGEHSIGATTARCIAWFTAAVTSGAPLVFVNIQSEQIISSEKSNPAGKESWKSRQQKNANVHVVQGIRLWFLPGVAEVQLQLIPKFGEGRFGMDIKRTEEGFICVNSVAKGLAADRAGLRDLREEARVGGHLLLISRLEGKSVIPSNASSAGLIHCCDHNEIRNKLVGSMNRLEKVEIHIMAWPNQAFSSKQGNGSAKLRPPDCRSRPPMPQREV